VPTTNSSRKHSSPRTATPPGSTRQTSTIRWLYERYQAAESDAERHEIALEMGELDGRRNAEIYAALEDE
jgi:hypothetical protein